MQALNIRFAVVVGEAIEPACPVAPSSEKRLLPRLDGRVVRLGDPLGSRERLHFLGVTYLADADSLRIVDAIRFQSGESVLYKGEPAVVRDVIWHWKEGRPNYYVTQRGRRLSKRLYDADLELLTGPA